MTTMRAAIEAGDPNALEGAAHTLKGALGNLVEPSRCAAASQLEAMGRRGDLADAPKAYAALETQIGCLKQHLEAVVRS